MKIDDIDDPFDDQNMHFNIPKLPPALMGCNRLTKLHFEWIHVLLIIIIII
jgi:hypothetical protein